MADEASVDSGLPSLVWVGPREAELGWLYGRLKSTCGVAATFDWQGLQPQGLPHGNRPVEQALQSLEESFGQGVQRVVLACENRWDYPAALIDWLGARWPEVPMALATSSWWEGAGRTGVGSATTAGVVGRGLLIPWYRWWDGWWPWLASLSGEWFDPASNLLPFFDARFDGRRGDRRKEAVVDEALQTVVLVCNHGELASGWKELCGRRPVLTIPASKMSELEQVAGEVGWCLIDDSSLNTVPHHDRNLQWSRLVRRCRDRFASSQIVCAMQQPEWQLWMSLVAAGANELLAKPSTGSGLRMLLASRD